MDNSRRLRGLFVGVDSTDRAEVLSILHAQDMTMRCQQAANAERYASEIALEPDVIFWAEHNTALPLEEAVQLLHDQVVVRPIIVLAREPDEAATVACLRLGAFDYVSRGRWNQLGEIVHRARAHVQAESLPTNILLRLIQIMADNVYVKDFVNQRTVYRTRSLMNVLGYPRDVSIYFDSDLMTTLIHPDDLPDLLHYQEVLKNISDESVYQFEHRVKNAAGEWRWVHTRNVALKRDLDGKVRYIAGITQDVTERKEMELRLREREERLNFIIEHSSDGTYFQDNDLRYVWAGKDSQFSTRDNLIGKFDSDIFNEADAATLTSIKQQVLKNGQPFEGEVTLHSNAETLIIAMTCVPRQDSNGRLLGVAVYVSDISQRRILEDAFQRSLKLFQTLVDTVSVGIFMTDPDRNATFLNARWSALYGIPP